MFILVTNDDGYEAPGLWVAYDLAHKLGGKNARIGVIAPKVEQSGVGHAVSYLSPLRAEKRREDHFLVDGTPADCILLTPHLFDKMPDLVISGINMGHNLGPDLLYSGTAGAAIEATAWGIPALSLSQFYSYETTDPDLIFATARSHGMQTLEPIWTRFGQEWPVGRFCNINFPACPENEVKGIKMCRAEPLTRSNMIARPQIAPNNREYFWLGHPGPITAHLEDQDVALAKNGHVTVSFCNLDLCDQKLCDQNSHLFENAK